MSSPWRASVTHGCLQQVLVLPVTQIQKGTWGFQHRDLQDFWVTHGQGGELGLCVAAAICLPSSKGHFPGKSCLASQKNVVGWWREENKKWKSHNYEHIFRSLHPNAHLVVPGKECHELVILTIGKWYNVEDIGVHGFGIWTMSSCFLSLIDCGRSFFLLWYRYKYYSPQRNMLEITVSVFLDIWGRFACTAWKMLSGGVSWQRLHFGEGGSAPSFRAGSGGGGIFLSPDLFLGLLCC